MLKALFYKYKIFKNHTDSQDEALKQWVLKIDTAKTYDKDNDSILKAQSAVKDLLNGVNPKPADLKAYLDLKKKYKPAFDQNSSELENPSQEDILNMDSLSLDEVKETIDDRKKTLFSRYFRSIVEIYRSSAGGEIIRPTSGGLLKKTPTPTNDFIDDQVDVYNPFDDTGVD